MDFVFGYNDFTVYNMICVFDSFRFLNEFREGKQQVYERERGRRKKRIICENPIVIFVNREEDKEKFCVKGRFRIGQ